MAKALDRIDDVIMRTLRDNARTPLVAIAKAAGLSRSATQERLRRLETGGHIAGYTIRYFEPDAGAVRVWMFLEFDPGKRCLDIVPSLMKHNQIRLCHSLSGKPDLLLLTEVDSHGDVMALRESIASVPGVAMVQTAPVLKAHFDAQTGEVSDILAGALPAN